MFDLRLLEPGVMHATLTPSDGKVWISGLMLHPVEPHQTS
jgi:hypothetical protein